MKGVSGRVVPLITKCECSEKESSDRDPTDHSPFAINVPALLIDCMLTKGNSNNNNSNNNLLLACGEVNNDGYNNKKKRAKRIQIIV